MTRVLIDDHLPHRDVRARHRIRVAAPTEEAYLALGATDRDVGGLVRLLLPARALAGALMKGRAGVRSLAARVRTPITPRTVEARGFSRLAERLPGLEHL